MKNASIKFLHRFYIVEMLVKASRSTLKPSAH